MEETKVINVVEKPNSFEFGKAGQRHKIYYGSEDELHEKIKSCVEADKLLLGLVSDGE